MILLDTCAVLFVLAAHPRGKALAAHAGGLAVSPISILELSFLVECGRIAFPGSDAATAVRNDPRFAIDDPPIGGVIAHAIVLSWTRDPFDRLLAAHALHRGWRLATSDRVILQNLPASSTLRLP